jgi:hypothetical protein
MEYSVRRIDPGSVFKIAFVLYGIAGLLISFMYELMFLFFSSFGARSLGPGMGDMFRVGSGIGAVLLFFLGIVFAFFYALMGAAFTALGAVIYNLLASSVGGVKVTLQAQGIEQHAMAGIGPYPLQAPVMPQPPAQAPVPPPYTPFPPQPPQPPQSPAPPTPPASPYAPPAPSPYAPPPPEEPPSED